MKSKVICIVFCLFMIINSGINVHITSSEPGETEAILWYGWQSRLVCINLNSDGVNADFTESHLIQDTGDPMPYTAFLSLTMLEDESLLWATQEGSTRPFISKIFHIEEPQCDGSTSTARYLGIMPEGIGIEALYTDFQNQVYIMDTGSQHSSSYGNRLLKFTGDVTTGDFSYEVVGSSTSVPDIDGMGPGIDETTGWVVDTPGFAIDSYNLYNVDYETGVFSYIGSNVGPYATHAINGSFYTDGKSRLFVITGFPQSGGTVTTLYEIDPDTGATIQNLGSGPSGVGLTGSLVFGPPDENDPPLADAGDDQVVSEGDLVILDGRNSSGSGNIVWDPHLVGLYHMNEDSGEVLHDSTPYENHGTIIGATWTSDSKWGNALSFDGVDDYVEVKPSNEIFGENPDEWSFMVWFRTTNYADNMSILSDYSAGRPRRDWNDHTHAIKLFLTSHLFGSSPYNPFIFAGYGFGNGHGRFGSTHNYADDNWHFIVVTYSKIGNILYHRLYINGTIAVSAGAGTMTSPLPDNFDGDTLYIGTRWVLDPPGISGTGHVFNPFQGSIDEIVLFNRTLTLEEILDYYNSSKEYPLYRYDNSGEIISYEWDFESDGIYDYQETPDNAPDGNFDGITTHTYGDNGEFTTTLRVTDENGEQDTDFCNITVLNVDPIGSIDSATMEVELGLRVAGRKFNDVGMTLSENEKIAGYVSIERMPGSPDDQMAWIPMTLNMTRTYSAVVTYTPEDPPNIGGNPTWIYIKFPNGSIQKIHHTFNVQQSKKRDSDHWNHIEPWEVDLNAHLIGWEFEVDYHITDPGSDDETLTFTYGSQNVVVEYLNNPPNPDPYPSPEVNPRDIYGTQTLIYIGAGTLALKVEDDDGADVELTLGLV